MRYQIRTALITIIAGMLLGSGAALAESNACKADLNGDLVVNFGDLAVLKSVFFQSCPRFEDRGKTIFDHQTGLEWEKKTADADPTHAGIHDKDNTYTWSTGTNKPNGTAFTVFLAGLNAGACSSTSDGTTESNQTDCSFAGHGDWRLPKLSELKTIVDCSLGAPCVAPIFGPTQSSDYWSSSSFAGTPGYAWVVGFGYGLSNYAYETGNLSVRAVRGGL